MEEKGRIKNKIKKKVVVFCYIRVNTKKAIKLNT